MITKVVKLGNSLAIRIPKKFTKLFNLEAGSTVNLTQAGNKIVMTLTRSRENRYKIIWPDDKPRGKEAW